MPQLPLPLTHRTGGDRIAQNVGGAGELAGALILRGGRGAAWLIAGVVEVGSPPSPSAGSPTDDVDQPCFSASLLFLYPYAK